MKRIIQERRGKIMKTKCKPMILLMIIFLLVNSSGCEELAMDRYYVIDLENQAEYSIGYYFATGGKFGTFYPDSLPETNDEITYDISEVNKPGYMGHLKWSKLFRELPHDTLSVFIFHTDTLKNNSWEEVRDHYKILKRYDLSLQDLEKMHFKIVYP
ncbi:MAG: hypothetical protein PHX49_08010 [Bacteroidales bacterium]|nr:hypothetical protein [Bacteroidales bacterium]